MKCGFLDSVLCVACWHFTSRQKKRMARIVGVNYIDVVGANYIDEESLKHTDTLKTVDRDA